MKQYVAVIGGIIAVSILLHYAINVWRKKAEAQSVATWLMWTLLDILLLTTTWLAEKPVWLPLGWTVGASLVTLSLFVHGQWVWSRKETLCTIATTVATGVWLTQGAVAGIVAGTLAMTCAGIPLLIDMARNPQRSTFPVWFFTVVACVCTLIGSDWTLASTFLPFGSITYNGILSILALRDRRSLVAVEEGRSM